MALRAYVEEVKGGSGGGGGLVVVDLFIRVLGERRA